MSDFFLTVLVCGVAGTCECVRLKKNNQQSEIVFYVLFSLIGLALFGLYTLWNDMPSVLDIIKAALRRIGW